MVTPIHFISKALAKTFFTCIVIKRVRKYISELVGIFRKKLEVLGLCTVCTVLNVPFSTETQPLFFSLF